MIPYYIRGKPRNNNEQLFTDFSFRVGDPSDPVTILFLTFVEIWHYEEAYLNIKGD